jgi:uncharacterized SAM-binding protein YcdF (DUF218 family)
MSFIVSKIFWFIFNIPSLLILLLFVGVVTAGKAPRLSRVLVSLALIFLIACSLPFLPHYLIQKLEMRIPAGKVTDDISGIIVLGGVLDVGICRQGHIELLDDADRIVYGIILAKEHPKAKLILSGGSGSLDQSQRLREADYLKQLSIMLGVDPGRIIIERNSRVTREHPLELQKIIDKKQKFVLVTSASHMPRAIGCFRKSGFNVIPYPVDYHAYKILPRQLSVNDFVPQVENIFISSDVIYEWYGLVFYRLMGYTGEFFPHP